VISSKWAISKGRQAFLISQKKPRFAKSAITINNSLANPISGTFSNLPDGGIVTIDGNNFQASYEGGDGNDLTLAVVP
jgi:hypothetical protein